MDITPLYGTIWALFPPIVAIILALLTKEVYSSLFIGILAGALMYSNFSFVGMIEHTISIISSRLGSNGGIIVFLICLSATLAGAVTGDHCSPISETAIMSSTAAQVDFMTHVMTQLPYALFTAGFSLIGFALMGLIQHWIVTPIMMLVIVVVLLGMKKYYSGKPVKVKYVSNNAGR